MNIKRLLFLASGIVTVTIIILKFLGVFKLCAEADVSQCTGIAYDMSMLLVPITALFLFSAITYKMRDEVFRVWAWFSLPAVLSAMYFTYIVPEHNTGGGGGFGPHISIIIDKATVAFVTSLLYVMLSALVVGITWIVVRTWHRN